MMRLSLRSLSAALLACALLTSRAQAEASLEIFAGGKIYQDTPASTVPLSPGDIAAGPNGTLYVTDWESGKVLNFNPGTYTITSVPNLPGLPEFRFADLRAMSYGPGVLNVLSDMEEWQLDLTEGFAQYFGVVSGVMPSLMAPDGTLYFTRDSDGTIYQRTTSGVVTAVAGSTTPGFSGDGTGTVQFNNPSGVIFDGAGNLYVADTRNNRVRKRTAATGIWTTIAGTGATSYNGDNLPAKQINLSAPTRLAIDAVGNLYIYEAVASRIRKLSASTGRINNFAGNGTYGGNPGNGGLATGASLADVVDMEMVGTTLYIAEQSAHRVRKIDASGIINQVIGNGTGAFCGEGVPARQACLDVPSGMAIDGGGNVYVADRGNGRIRKISSATGLISTIAGGDGSTPVGDGGPASAAHFRFGPGDIAMDASRNLYVLDGNQIRRIDGVTGYISTIAGALDAGFAGDGGLASAALFSHPVHIALDQSGNLYISDQANYRVRRIDAATGVITTVAGNGTGNGPLGDGGPATAASIWQPNDLAFDSSGNLLIGDVYHGSIRKVDHTTGVITTIAGNGTYNISGDGGPALAAGIGFRSVFAVDPDGNIYITSSYELRRIDARTGIIDKVPAPIWGLVTPEGFVLKGATDVVLSADNRLYIADASTNNMVFRVNALPTSASDVTPPVVEPVLSGTAGNNGWYTSDVQVTWSITDPESAVTTKVGCTDGQVTYDTQGTQFSCRATSGGGTTQKYVYVKRDATPPTLDFGAPSPAPGANGWYGGDVSIPFTASDAMSGVYSTSSGSPLTFDFSREGAALTQQVVVTDSAGNVAFFTSPPVNIDRTAPVIHASISGTAGNAGWYRSDVVVSWSVDDDASLISSSGCASTTIDQDTPGTTLTCTATSPGGTNTQSVTIKRDATPPTLTFGEALPAADAKGWRAAPVAVAFETSDATSGVANTSAPSPLPITGTGAGVTAQVTVTDVAGNSSTFTSPAFNIDASAPTVSHSITGTPGNNGWYRSDVRVTWQVSEPDSEVHTEGCSDSLVTTDSVGTTFTCTASSNGGVASDSVTIRRDTVPPELTFGDVSPAPYANGFIGSAASIPFTVDDATSGIESSSSTSPLVFSEAGEDLTKQVTVTDVAGNSASFTTRRLNIDLTPPVIDVSVIGTAGNNGWYTSDVQVTWTVDDLARGSVISGYCPASTLIDTDTAGTTLTCDITSNGGRTSRSVTIKRDATPPVLTFGTPSPAPNTAGWNKTNVSIPFTRSDAMSGLASTSVASPLVLSSDGANVTGQVVVTDLAGNSATFTSVPRNIDKTAPVAEMNTPEDNGTYGFYQDVVADYWCTDSLLVSCTAPVANGALINTKTAGTNTFKITAKDSVYTTTHTHTYTVESGFNFDGFLAPASAAPTLNLVTRGALVPIRWQLPDGHGGFVTNTASFSSATVGSLTCGSAAAVPLDDTASGAAGISFDAATQSFVYNWQTSASWTGCRKLTIKLKDSSTHELRFKFQ